MHQIMFLFKLMFIFIHVRISFGNSTTGCGGQEDCLLCKSSGCVKCSTLIIYPTRECVTKCPVGYKLRWSSFTDYMGQICVYTGYLGGISAESAAVIIGVGSGIVTCLLIIAILVFYIRYKRQKQLNLTTDSPSEVEDSPERRDFIKQLETLRPHAQVFLNILNDTRRQIRQLHATGDNVAITVYRPVVRDLAKILILINKPPDKLITVPDDWEILFSSAENILKRFKRMSEASQPQVAQLVSFLQTPTETQPPTLTTFQTGQSSESAISLQDLSVKSCADNFSNVLNPQWNFNYSLISTNQMSTDCTTDSWPEKDYLNSSYLLEDDFFQFGFRPQDEITTEL